MIDPVVRPSFSLVIPTFNEERHLDAALRSVLGQTYPRFDVVVVDDGSTDRTREIIERFTLTGRVTLVAHEVNRGSGAARNSGVDNATSEVVVFVDADVTLPHDFLERVAADYRAGADAVAVESRVADQRFVVCRFQQAVHQVNYPDLRGVVFSQAFSCKTSIARSLRFDEQLPGCAADDSAFGERLLAADYVVARKPDLVVEHMLPRTVTDLWHQQFKRGCSVVHSDLHVRRRSLRAMALRRTLASLKALLELALVVPTLVQTARLVRCSGRGRADAVAFWLLHYVHVIAYRWGQLTEAGKLVVAAFHASVIAAYENFSRIVSSGS
jgi:glycosyltransferase involved in cell wall biosynthesis